MCVSVLVLLWLCSDSRLQTNPTVDPTSLPGLVFLNVYLSNNIPTLKAWYQSLVYLNRKAFWSRKADDLASIFFCHLCLIKQAVQWITIPIDTKHHPQKLLLYAN